MSEAKTHYRKAFNSPYLSSADIVEAVTLTIDHVTLEPDRTKKTKDLFNTAHFKQKEIREGEPLKPMILNATNSRTMKDITGTPFIDDWRDVPVVVYVDPGVRFGRETVEGLRLKEAKQEKLATAAQWALIEEYGAGMDEETQVWLKKNSEALTETLAARLINKLKKAAE